MSEIKFCYCCRVHHPIEVMRPFQTKSGPRWRCIRSIEAAACDRHSRDDFGRKQSEINREISRSLTERTPITHLDRMPAT